MTSDVSGYKKNKQKNIQSSASLNYDFGTITPVLKGLSAKALFSYDYRLDNNESYRKEYYQYAYDDLTDTYTQKCTTTVLRATSFEKCTINNRL